MLFFIGDFLSGVAFLDLEGDFFIGVASFDPDFFGVAFIDAFTGVPSVLPCLLAFLLTLGERRGLEFKSMRSFVGEETGMCVDMCWGNPLVRAQI